MRSVAEIIEMMHGAAPAGQPCLDDTTAERLRKLTGTLIANSTTAVEEHARFLAIGRRGLCLPERELAGLINGSSVLVTGGTGCIGSVLLAELAARHPGRLVSVSRGVTGGWPEQEGARYLHADIRDRAAMDRLIGEVAPDIIFHVAAQRSPGAAETEVHRTVSTNVIGTRNVLDAASRAGVPRVVCASTGKALRPYSPEIYTASKRAAEWVAAGIAAEGGTLISAGRFTHVVDNSIIYRRLREWAAAEDGVIRLHCADIAFYAQSALESAQLLLLSALGGRPGELRVHAITDLGWPVSLLDIALGVLAETGSRTPVYFSGYDPGYEEIAFPGLYDPATAGDVSPLLNAFEAATVVPTSCPMTDTFRLDMVPEPRAAKLLSELDEACERTRESDVIRAALGELSWSLLDCMLRAASPRVLARTSALLRPHQEALTPDHERVMRAILDQPVRD